MRPVEIRGTEQRIVTVSTDRLLAGLCTGGAPCRRIGFVVEHRIVPDLYAYLHDQFAKVRITVKLSCCVKSVCREPQTMLSLHQV